MQLVLLAFEMLKKAMHPAKGTATVGVAINDQLLLFGVEFVPGHVRRYPGLAREALQFGKQRPVLWLSPGLNGALIQSLSFIRNNKVEIEIDGVAEALAAGACSVRIIERKQTRLRFLVAGSVDLAFEAM